MALLKQTRRKVRLASHTMCLVVAMAVVGVQAPLAPDQAWAARTADDDTGPDRLFLKNGKVIEGWIESQNDVEVKIVMVSAGIKATRTFKMTEIHEIRIGEEAAAEGAEEPPERAPIRASNRMPAGGPNVPEMQGAEGDSAQVYLTKLEGRWGVDVSETPLQDLFNDVDRTFSDLVPGAGMESGRMVVDPLVRDKHIVVLKLDLEAPSGFNAIFRAEELAPIVMNEMTLKGRRVVFWVEKAAGGAAFLPWVSPEMYFTSDGRLGGMADLDQFKTGDEMVDEKLIGAFQGSAEGFAIQGGYQDHLVVMQAMLRKQNWLFVRFVGGKPEYATKRPENPSGWLLLSDDGDGDNEDDSVLEGNDILSLDAKIAMELGISGGTAETIDDLIFHLGPQFHRNYEEIEDHKGQRIVDRWNQSIDDTIRKINPDSSNGHPLGTLWEEYEEIDVQGDFRERQRLRGRKIKILRDIMALYRKYEEVLDPGGQWQESVEFNIDQHKLEQQIDTDNQRRGGR